MHSKRIYSKRFSVDSHLTEHFQKLSIGDKFRKIFRNSESITLLGDIGLKIEVIDKIEYRCSMIDF